MMKLMPLSKVASQTLSATLADQIAGLKIYQLRTGLYMDVYKDGLPIINGVICQNLNRIVRSAYLGFSGDFVWYDSQGNSDPTYVGFGERFFLYYLDEDEISNVLAAA